MSCWRTQATALLLAALVLAGCASRSTPPLPPVPTTETWADYSMMFRAGGGVLFAGEQVASRYAWQPVSDTESHIYWGDPATWPPAYHERFVRVGDWVMLIGWWDNGTFYRIATTQQRLCNAACGQCSALPDGAAQHYVRWLVPAAPYCLQAEGVITEESSGKTLRYRHEQRYSPPAACANATFADQRCITQHETWWDDNQTPFQLKLDRVNFLAAGLGMGFAVRQSFPAPWSTELRTVSAY